MKGQDVCLSGEVSGVFLGKVVVCAFIDVPKEALSALVPLSR